MNLENVHGIQANLLYKISRKRNIDQNFGLCVGTSEVKDGWLMRDWTYIGAIYELNFHGFFIQPGLSIGDGDFSSPQLLFQIGYVYRFNN